MISLTFPAGQLLTESVSTGGDVTTDISPGTRKNYQFLYGNVRLITNADVANRYLILEILDGSGNKLLSPLVSSPAIPASTSKDLNISTNWAASYGSPTAADYMVSVGSWILIQGDDVFRVRCHAGVAGDSITGYFRFREFGL